MITKIDYEAGSTAINMEVRIWRDSWTAQDKVITRYWSFPNAAAATQAAMQTMAQNEVTAYQDMKAQATALNSLVGVPQILP